MTYLRHETQDGDDEVAGCSHLVARGDVIGSEAGLTREAQKKIGEEDEDEDEVLKRALDMVEEKKDEAAPYKCPMCPRSFDDVRLISQHVNSHFSDDDDDDFAHVDDPRSSPDRRLHDC